MMPKVSTKKITTMSEVKEISKYFQTLKLFSMWEVFKKMRQSEYLNRDITL